MSDSHPPRLKYLLSLIFLLFACPAQGQTNVEPARKFDEFGDIQASDLIARLDNFAVTLQNEPHARGFLVVYRTRRDLPGLANRYAHRMKGYLVETRGIEPARVVTVDGGYVSCLTQELWVVPIGATPQPRQDAYPNQFDSAAYKFDEHYYARSSDTIEIGYWPLAPENLNAYLEAFALALQKNPRADAYLVAYTSGQFDRTSFAREMLRRERDFLIRQYGIKPARIKTVNGGQVTWRRMELWIVPPGEGVPYEFRGRIFQPRRRR